MNINYFHETIIPDSGLPLESMTPYRKYYEDLGEVNGTIHTIQVNIQYLSRGQEIKGLKTFYQSQLAFWLQHKENLIKFIARGGRTDYN